MTAVHSGKECAYSSLLPEEANAQKIESKLNSTALKTEGMQLEKLRRNCFLILARTQVLKQASRPGCKSIRCKECRQLANNIIQSISRSMDQIDAVLNPKRLERVLTKSSIAT